MKSTELPVGYLRCMDCGEPALWLTDNVSYTPRYGNDVSIKIKYKLINLKIKGLDPDVFDYYICDSCQRKIQDENYDQEYLIFLEDSDEIETRQ